MLRMDPKIILRFIWGYVDSCKLSRRGRFFKQFGEWTAPVVDFESEGVLFLEVLKEQKRIEYRMFSDGE